MTSIVSDEEDVSVSKMQCEEKNMCEEEMPGKTNGI